MSTAKTTWTTETMNIETATADQLYGLLLAVHDRLNELAGDGRLTLARDGSRGQLVDIETASASELYRLLLDVQDRLSELVGDDRLTLARDAEQVYGTARNAAGVVAGHLDAARQALAVLETS